MTMTLHNYKSRQFHKTLNGLNRSSGFSDLHSAKSGSNLCQVFGPWASPYGANGQMTMTMHNYRPRQFHRTSNGKNPSNVYRDMGSASLVAAHPAARPPGPWWQYPEGWGVKTRFEMKNVNITTWGPFDICWKGSKVQSCVHYIHIQDRCWNAEKPSATLDP